MGVVDDNLVSLILAGWPGLPVKTSSGWLGIIPGLTFDGHCNTLKQRGMTLRCCWDRGLMVTDALSTRYQSPVWPLPSITLSWECSTCDKLPPTRSFFPVSSSSMFAPHLCFEQAQPKVLAYWTPMKEKTNLALQSWRPTFCSWNIFSSHLKNKTKIKIWTVIVLKRLKLFT